MSLDEKEHSKGYSKKLSKEFEEELREEKEQLFSSDIGNVAQIRKWIEDIFFKMLRKERALGDANPFKHKKDKLTNPDDVDISNSGSIDNFCQEHFDSLGQLLSEQDRKFYEDKYNHCSNMDKGSEEYAIEQRALNESLHKFIQEKLSIQAQAWHLEQANKIKKEMWDELKDRIEEMDKIKHHLDSLDSSGAGVFWDLARGDLMSSDISQLAEWSNILDRDKNLKKLIDMIGRAVAQQVIKKKQMLKQMATIDEKIPVVVDSITSKEEIKSIELGNDLMRVIPQEMLCLGDEDLEILFYQKYMEKTLLCYHLQGQDVEYNSISKDIEIDVEKEVEEADKKGPIIVCVDTSGSMEGTPETVAKATTLSLASRAIAEDRKCFIINFSTGIKTFKLDKDIGMKGLMKFLQMSFHGGTDVTPALDEALRQLEKKDFKKADVLTISDFIMGELETRTLRKIETQKLKETKFYGLNIGVDIEKPNYLDKQWIYNTDDNNIIELSEDIVAR